MQSNVVIVRPADLSDVSDLVRNLRPEDHREIASTQGDVDHASLFAYAIGVSTSAFTAIEAASGRVVCMGGVGPRGDGTGSVWLHGTPLMRTHALSLARMTPEAVKLLHRDFRILSNWADTRNTLHIRWLQWAGFRFLRTTTTHSLDGSPFVEFFRMDQPPCATPSPRQFSPPV